MGVRNEDIEATWNCFQRIVFQCAREMFGFTLMRSMKKDDWWKDEEKEAVEGENTYL